MRIPRLSRKTYLLISVLTAALLPAVMMFVSQLMAGISIGVALAEMGDACLRPKLNPVLTVIFNVPAFALLTLIACMYHKRAGARKALFVYAGGYIGAMLCLLWAHLDFWPQHYRSGPLPFPHGLVMIIGPMLAVVTAGVGMVVGALIARGQPAS